MPGYAPLRVGAPGSKAPSTHLATYWWGLEEKVAKEFSQVDRPSARMLRKVPRRVQGRRARSASRTRHRDCEVQAFRRGAAALCACSAGIDAGDEHKHGYLDGFRKLVPGEPLAADDAFVNSLEREQGKVSLWAVASVDGAACPIVDVGDSSAYAGAVLAKASVDLSDAATVRQTLVEAMAGASDEARCMAGPPRRRAHRVPRRPGNRRRGAAGRPENSLRRRRRNRQEGRAEAERVQSLSVRRRAALRGGRCRARRRPREQAAAQRPSGRRRAVAAGQEALRGHAGGDGRAARDRRSRSRPSKPRSSADGRQHPSPREQPTPLSTDGPCAHI